MVFNYPFVNLDAFYWYLIGRICRKFYKVINLFSIQSHLLPSWRLYFLEVSIDSFLPPKCHSKAFVCNGCHIGSFRDRRSQKVQTVWFLPKIQTWSTSNLLATFFSSRCISTSFYLRTVTLLSNFLCRALQRTRDRRKMPKNACSFESSS